MKRKVKVSRYFGQFVKAVRKINGKFEIREGILRGYLGSYVLIDTGDFFFEQFPIGTASGRWLVMPVKTKLEIRDSMDLEAVREQIALHANAKRASEEEEWQLDSDFSQNDWMLDEAPYESDGDEFGESEDEWEEFSDASVTEWQCDLEGLPAYYPITASMDAEAYNDYAE